MAFTITSEVDEAHLIEAATAELTSADSAASYVGDNCLSDGPVGRVGLEVEAHCFDLADPMRRPDWDELTETIAGVPTLPGGSAVTVEPGGAVELSGPPMDGPMPAIAAMAADRAVLRAAFARAGLGLVLLGADPLRPAETCQSRRPLPGDGAVLRRQPDRGRRRGDDDLDGVGSGQPRRRAAGRLGRPGSPGACARARP